MQAHVVHATKAKVRKPDRPKCGVRVAVPADAMVDVADPPRTKRLPATWSKWLAGQPETGMDYQTGDVLLRDGRIVQDVAIVGASLIGEVRGQETIPFDPEDIIEIRLTHKKWHWRGS